LTTDVPPLRSVLEGCLYAEDLDAAERFYGVVLDLPILSRSGDRHVFFRCGRGVFLVFNPERTASEAVAIGGVHVPRHGASGPGHVAFAVREGDLPAWRERLQLHGVAIEAEIAWPAGGRSLYFRDPAGNSLELATPAVWGLPEDD
jgi:catechol 2,3-dioxygenase-like lactoylglutathione lyase family enzyme